MNSKDQCATPGLMPIDEAVATMLGRARAIDSVESLELSRCIGHTLAAPVIAAFDSPRFSISMMDGYAVNSAHISESMPVGSRITAGSTAPPLATGEAARIFTGAPLPAGADSVVIQERCTESDGKLTINGDIEPGANILHQGSNNKQGQVLIETGTLLQPQHLGIAATQGLDTLNVYPRLQVSLINTGNELVMPGQPLEEGQIYNSNYFTIGGLLARMGFEVLSFDVVEDDPDQTFDMLEHAAENADAVITTGGVSVGEEDYVRQTVEKLGELEIWRVRIKPGKPFAFGQLCGTPYIGLPGNPVSAFVTFCLLARPFLLARQGRSEVMQHSYPVIADFDLDRPNGRDQFLSARLRYCGANAPKAELIEGQNSAALNALLAGDGLLHIPADTKITRGTVLQFMPFCDLLG